MRIEARMVRAIGAVVCAAAMGLGIPLGAAGEMTTVVPGPQFAKSGLYRFYFGSGYRKLWTTPIEVEYLDLRTFGGGLTPTGTGGGAQTRALRFVGADGRPYTFRPMMKSLQDLIPDTMKGTFLEEVVEDQVSSAHPTAPPVVGVLLDELGILHGHPRIVAIPNDSLLGEYREHFAGQVGTIEEWANEGEDGTPGFAGATDVISTEELFGRLQEDGAERVDARKFLTARLLDLFIGDWDRHRGQFRWANVGPGTPPAWEPVPEDRDQAFAKFDGLFLSVARTRAPQLINFGDKYGSMLGITWNGRDMDRRFLVGLSSVVWDSVAASVRDRLTDEVFERALREMPAAHQALVGEEMLETLRRRRAQLPEIARRYFRHLAGEVDIHCTDTADRIDVNRREDGAVDVEVDFENAPAPFVSRKFFPSETGDIRVYLYGGDDEVTVHGEGPDKITVRVISGSGNDRVLDSSRSGGTRVYDARETGGVADGQGLRVDRRPYQGPPTPPGRLPPRNWGSRSIFFGAAFFSGDLGFMAVAGLDYERYAFRKDPYAWKIEPNLAYSTGKESGRAAVDVEKRRENSHFYGTLRVLASGIEKFHFFGLGNETAPADDDTADVEQNVFQVEPGIAVDLSPHATVSFSVPIEYSKTELDPATLLGRMSVYGTRDWWQAGGIARVDVDTREQGSASRAGVHLSGEAGFYPEIFEVASGSFGFLDADAAGYYSPSRRVTLAGRLGGKKIWGDFPYFDAAYIGGSANVRGFSANRFAGDASLFGSLELRLELARFFLLVPGQGGFFGLVDTGRVFNEGQESSRWHTSYGGGIWVAPLERANAFSFAVANSSEDTRIYFQYGFNF